MRRTLVIVIAALALVVLSGCLGPPIPPPQGGTSTMIPCSESNGDHVITADTDLDPACTYTGHFRVTSGGVRLDCHGARITGTDGTGIEVSTPADVTMVGVRVQNCDTDGFLNGVRVTRSGFRALPAGHEYDNNLSDVLLQDVHVANSRGVGIYVDGYVTHTIVLHASVTNAGSSGIYLEAGSRDNVVTYSTITDNGFIENGPDGQLFTFSGQQFRHWGPGREGLSIDGSYNNWITRNTFSGNAAGGIYLYTNCSEFVHQKPATYFERRTQAEHNNILNNHFVGGLNGIWVGSRMSDNTFPMDCSQTPYRTGPGTSITLDHAPHNLIRQNDFIDVVHGVRVEDDDTKVLDNTFTAPDPSYHAVIIGTKWRTTDLRQPVTGTVVAGNVSNIAGNSNPYRWTFGIGAVTVTGNTALGQPTGICAAPDMPIELFVMVYAIALEPVGSPPVPKPQFAIPRLPALPAC